MSRLPSKGIDYTSKDYESFRTMMLNSLGVFMPEYTDRSQTDAGVVIIELLSMGLDILSMYQDIIANETLLPTAEQRSNILKWCNILSYEPQYATPSIIEQVFILSSVRGTDTKIPVGTVIKTQGSATESPVMFETVEDLVIPAGKLGDEKDEFDNYLYSVNAVQGLSILDEMVGSSNGTKNQSFKLKYSPAIYDSVNVMVNEGSGFEPWTRVQNFIDSGPSSKHYTLYMNDRDEAVITFGDGIFGKIPNKYTQGIYANYRIGGGVSGNVGANKVVLMDSPISYIKETFNPGLPIEYGTDKESVESLKLNAPNSHRTIWGALTYQDFADVAILNFPEIKYAQSVVNSEDKFSIDLYILLNSTLNMTEEFKKEVSDLFSLESGGRELAGMNTVNVKDPVYEEISFIADLVVFDGYSKDTVESQVQEYLEDYFKVGNYPFNQELSLTSLSSEIMRGNVSSGIKSFKFTSPSDDILIPESGKIYKMKSIVFNTTGGV